MQGNGCYALRRLDKPYREVLVLWSIWQVRSTCVFFVSIRHGTIMLLQKAMDFDYQYSKAQDKGRPFAEGWAISSRLVTTSNRWFLQAYCGFLYRGWRLGVQGWKCQSHHICLLFCGKWMESQNCGGRDCQMWNELVYEMGLHETGPWHEMSLYCILVEMDCIRALAQKKSTDSHTRTLISDCL